MLENTPYQIIKSKRKTYSIDFASDGTLRVKVPYYFQNKDIFNVIEKHKNWILDKSNLLESKLNNPTFKAIQSNEKFMFKGILYDIEISGKVRIAEISQVKILIPRSFEKKLNEFLPTYFKKVAIEFYKRKTSELSELNNFKFKSVKLSSAKRRWGSCSSIGNINLNWRLIMAPVTVIESVILHELSHTIHMNHSSKFYNLLDKIDKNRNSSDKWLKDNSFILDLYN